MNTKESRRNGAIWGQLIGDAATLGTHWIYDTQELLDRYQGKIEGFESPLPGHYHEGKAAGEQTHYGDAALSLIEAIESKGGTFDSRAFGKHFGKRFASPEYKGYRDHATKETLENIAHFASANPGADIPFETLGSSDDQMASVTSLAPLAAIAKSKSDAIANAERFTRVRQNNDRAVAYSKAMAIIIWNLIDGIAPRDAIESAVEELDPDIPAESEADKRIRAAIESLGKSVHDATPVLGQSCPLSGSVPSAIHAFLTHRDDFRNAILETIKAGGDNAGRAAIVGSLAGAAGGKEAIPEEWIEKLAAKKKIDEFQESLPAPIDVS